MRCKERRAWALWLRCCSSENVRLRVMERVEWPMWPMTVTEWWKPVEHAQGVMVVYARACVCVCVCVGVCACVRAYRSCRQRRRTRSS